ncbi:hypothetical protein [Thioclava sp. GXIMD4216]|uniref:Arginine transporter n=1 Tax=Thioclava litoralis TaxID=3076557 RepID=A0ABZ1DZ28_9RHOB|nr:hypothetical protein RPE78_08095 [Thioclava sp. FTW29]
MKNVIRIAATAFTLSLCMGSIAKAGPLDRACQQGGRTSNSELCSCIQNVADITLSNSDQRRAAKFFTDPDKAQEVRTSSRPSDTDFWARYKNFVSAAEGYCG